MISAPYRFVPLSNLIIYPSWSEQVSHDKPFRYGVCGSISLKLTNKTLLCVGSEQNKTIDETNKSNEPINKVSFYRDADGIPVIPSTSLSSMVKNVLKIASFARLKEVEDQNLSMRDISKSNNFYLNKMKDAETGWLKFDAKQSKWVIYPCRMHRVHHSEIIRYFNIGYRDWVNNKNNTGNTPASLKYQLVYQKTQQADSHYIQCAEVQFISPSENNKSVSLFRSDSSTGEPQSPKQGHLVMTGQIGNFYHPKKLNEKGVKKYEFIFYDTSDKALRVPSSVMKAFMQIYQATEEWQFWQQKTDIAEYGIPVFYHRTGKNSGDVRSLGLSYLYKLPYKNSIHDAIANVNASHIYANNQDDFAELLQGYGDSDKTTHSGLKGRIDFSPAKLVITDDCITNNGKPDTTTIKDKFKDKFTTKKLVLVAPKPTFYPFYIRQTNKQGKDIAYNQLMDKHAQIAGWKRYQAKKTVDDKRLAENKNIQKEVEALLPNNEFELTLTLHNVLPVELGAVLWALDFGERHDCWHGLGLGKPYGMGGVQFDIVDSELIKNDFGQIVDKELYLQGCRQEFIDYMKLAFVKNGINDTTWEACDPITALIELATPIDNLEQKANYEQKADSYAYMDNPKQFSRLKNPYNNDHLSQVVDVFHHYQPVMIDDPTAIVTVDYQCEIDKKVDQLISVKAKQSKWQQREVELETAYKNVSDEEKTSLKFDKALLEIEKEIDHVKDNPDEYKQNNTYMNDAHKTLIKPYDEFFKEKTNLTAEQVNRFKNLAKEYRDLLGSKKQLDKIVKKINNLS